MGDKSEAELNELYGYFKSKPGYPELLRYWTNTRIKQLLKTRTIYGKLPNQFAKTAFVLVLSHGAAIDNNGLLIVNNESCRRAIASDQRMRFLPREIISPQTTNFANLKIFEPTKKPKPKTRDF